MQLAILWCYDFNRLIVHICDASSTIFKKLVSNACPVACFTAAYKWIQKEEYTFKNSFILQKCYNGSKEQEHQIEKYSAEQAMDGKVVYFPEQFIYQKRSVGLIVRLGVKHKIVV